MQAKGILPKGTDSAMKSPNAEGYFIYVSLDPNLTRDQAIALLTSAKGFLDELVLEDQNGWDPADVVVGFSPKLFGPSSPPRLATQVPTGFGQAPPIPGVVVDSDIIFYIASVEEERVSRFLTSLWSLRPAVTAVDLDRGYQRKDGTEVFGYKDGGRNVKTNDRYRVVFVHEDSNPEEPSGAIGGSYMAFMRIVQNPDEFAKLDTVGQDQVIGRRRDASRLDLPEGSDSKKDGDMPDSEPPAFNSHVRKVGPRGPHDDVQIFRRGLPFMKVDGGQVRVGLNFVSFQASLDQLDVVLNDWMMNAKFPQNPSGTDPGVDRLFEPTLGITSIEKSGLFFVPPHDERFLGATMFDEPKKPGKVKTGQVSVRKKVTDPNNPGARFERGGFRFQIVDQTGNVLSTFVTDSKGHGQSDEIPVGTYTLQELPPEPPRPEIQIAGPLPLELKSAHEVVPIQNQVTQPGSGYGAR